MGDQRVEIRKERRRGRTNRMGWRWCVYLDGKEAGMDGHGFFGPRLVPAEFFTRGEARDFADSLKSPTPTPKAGEPEESA